MLNNNCDPKDSYLIPELLVSRNFISVTVSCSYGKWYPILDQASLISIPYPRRSCSKPLPLTAAHTYLPYVWEYPPGKGGGVKIGKRVLKNTSWGDTAAVGKYVRKLLPTNGTRSCVYSRQSYWNTVEPRYNDMIDYRIVFNVLLTLWLCTDNIVLLYG